MRATGIIRRVDDLGRIVIPREVRHILSIKEGTPLEFFTNEGGICLYKYKAYENATWETANKVLSPIIKGYAIFDEYGEAVRSNDVKLKNVEEAEDREDLIVEQIKLHNDVCAYIAVSKENNADMIKLALQVFYNLLSEKEGN